MPTARSFSPAKRAEGTAREALDRVQQHLAPTRSAAAASFFDQIGVVILAHNEAPNIGRALDALRRFPEVLIVDSGSTDGTVDIVARYDNARLLYRPFDSHAMQWNFALENCSRPWVLALDADYIVSESLTEEIGQLSPVDSTSGYRASFAYWIYGKPLSATLYPRVVVLYRREGAHYVQIGHTQRVVVDGAIAELKNRICHDDRKPLSHWLASQQRYAALEADHLAQIPVSAMRLSDRIRRLSWPAPILVFLYTLLVKRCVFDGWRGWFYVMQRTLAETMMALHLVDRKLKSRSAAVRGRK